MFSMSSKGDWSKTERSLKKLLKNELYSDLDKYGQIGVQLLAQATPQETGLTAQSWRYRVIRSGKYPGLEWYNTNTVNGTPVAILIQYGHATGTGGYVQGREFINQAMQPLFDEIAADVWKKVRDG